MMRVRLGPRAREIRARVSVCEKRLEKSSNRRTRASGLSSATYSRTRGYLDEPLEPVISVALFVPSEST